MKVKNNKNVAKAISAIGKSHKIKRNKIKRLTEKKGNKKKKISKKALIEVGLKTDVKKPKSNVESTKSITNDSLVKLTNISYKGVPENSTPHLHKQQKKSEGNKTQLSFIRRMKDKLKGARFRYLNEQFYSSTSQDALQYFQKEPDAFKAYHKGYMQQVIRWPVKPLDVIIKQITPMLKKSKNNSPVVADFGCGDAKLAQQFPDIKIHSFDLIAVNEYVTAGDMAHTSLANGSIDIVVFCLSLMGTNLQSFIKEANRVLKIGGLMKIAEVESRFDNINMFVDHLTKFGFENKKLDRNIEMFVFMDFKKTQDISKTALKKKLPILEMKPCIYKRR